MRARTLAFPPRTVPLWLLVRFLVEALLLLPDCLLEALLEQRQLRDEIGDGVHQRLLLEEGRIRDFEV